MRTFSKSEKNHIKLSLCISTFNRSFYIKSTLESIIKEYSRAIEIIIYDVSTNALTQAVVDSLSSIETPINYTHSNENLGIDQDFDKAIQIASGEYCWLLSDDDLIKQGAINRVLTELFNNCDLLVVNAEIRNSDLTKILQSSILPKNTKLSFNKHDNELFFITAANCLSYIGSVVIKRSLWSIREKDSYFDTMFAHVGVIFQSPPLELIRIVNEPLIEIRHGNASWNSRAFEIWAFKWPKLIWSFTTYGAKSKQAIYFKEPYKNFKFMMFYRACGHYGYKEYKKYFYKNKPLLLNIYLLSLSVIPGYLLNTLSALYIFLFKRKNLTAIYDLYNSKYNNMITAYIYKLLMQNQF